MLKKSKKIFILGLLATAMLTTSASALSWTQVGIGYAPLQRNAYTGVNGAVWAFAEVAYNGSFKSATSGDQEGTTLTSIWVQTKYIYGIGGTAHGHHQALSTTQGLETYTQD